MAKVTHAPEQTLEKLDAVTAYNLSFQSHFEYIERHIISEATRGKMFCKIPNVPSAFFDVVKETLVSRGYLVTQEVVQELRYDGREETSYNNKDVLVITWIIGQQQQQKQEVSYDITFQK